MWIGTAMAVIAAGALVVLGLRARQMLGDETTPEVARPRLVRLAAYNGAALGAGVLGIGLMVVGAMLR